MKHWIKLRPGSRVLEFELLSVLTTAGFRMLGVPRTQAFLRRWASRGKTCQNAEQEIRIARSTYRLWLRRTARRGTCLTRSCVLWAVLLRRGISTKICTGFRKRDGKLEGHAWVEYGGISLNEKTSALDTYVMSTNPQDFDLYNKIGQP